MPSLLSDLPVWGVALTIFLLRMVDVTLGTMRTISIVNGRTRLAVALGFVEITIWITALSEVVARMADAPVLMVAFAAGFAAGNGLGITLERHLAIGSCVVRLITGEDASRVAGAVGGVGRMVTSFTGVGDAGPRTLVYALCARRDLPELLQKARAVDRDVFYAVERFPETSPLTPVFSPTGWRSVLKKK